MKENIEHSTPHIEHPIVLVLEIRFACLIESLASRLRAFVVQNPISAFFALFAVE